MEITVNQKTYQVNQVCSVLQMLAVVLNKSAAGIAIAVNQAIIPKANWSSHLLHPDDQIIIINATQGG